MRYITKIEKFLATNSFAVVVLLLLCCCCCICCCCVVVAVVEAFVVVVAAQQRSFDAAQCRFGFAHIGHLLPLFLSYFTELARFSIENNSSFLGYDTFY